MEINKKIFRDCTDGSIQIITRIWRPGQDHTNELHRMHANHVYQIILPLAIMQELIRMAARHGWRIASIKLSPVYYEEEKKLNSLIRNMHGSCHLILQKRLSDIDQNSEFDWCVDSITIADGNGGSIRVRINGDLVETGHAEEIEKAVVETIQNHLD